MFTAGLLFAVSLTLVSFEWRTPYKSNDIIVSPTTEPPESVWIPVTLSEPEKKRERPEAPKLEKPTGIDIVDKVEEKEDQKEPAILAPDDLPGPEGPLEMPEEKEADDGPMEPIRIASKMPEYCGGENAMFEFLLDELKYPEIARTTGITGTVYIEFVVGSNGKLRDAKVKRPVDPWLDAEALRVAKMLECFEPGMQGGKLVDVYFILPIRFSLGG